MYPELEGTREEHQSATPDPAQDHPKNHTDVVIISDND